MNTTAAFLAAGAAVVGPPGPFPLRDPAGNAPAWQADYREQRYWSGGDERPDFAAWLATLTGTFARSHTSASPAYYRDANGAWQETVANQPRFHHSAAGEPLGLWLEGNATDLLQRSRDLSNAAWTKSNATATLTATGLTGVVNTASLVTFTSAGGYVERALTRASSAHFTLAQIRRVTGTGAILYSLDGGVTSVDIAGQINTSGLVEVRLPAQTLANPAVRLTGAVSGDAIAVDFINLVTAGIGGMAYPSSPIQSAGSNTTRGRETYTIPQTGSEGTIVIEGRTGPAYTGVEEMFARWRNNAANSRMEVYRTTVGMFVRVWTSSSVVALLNLGMVDHDTDFKIAIGVKTNDFAASMDGRTVSVDTAGTFDAMTVFDHWLNNYEFYGFLADEAFYTTKFANGDLPYYSERDGLQYLVVGGDSYAAGAGGVGLAATLGTLMGRNVASAAAGGLTVDAAKDALLALHPQVRARAGAWWDGSPNGYGTVSDYLDKVAEAADACPRMVMIPPVVLASYSGADKAATAQIQAAMATTYAGRTVDAQALLDDGTGVVASGYLQGDNTHLTQPAMSLVAAPVRDVIDAQG